MNSMMPAAASEVPLTERTHGNANAPQQAAVVWRKLPIPVIAAIHGVCFGGGLQIASGADIKIVAPDARLAVMEVKWGLIPDMGGYWLWRGNVRDDVLRELTYTHREFTGEEAVAFGFATHLCSPFFLAYALQGLGFTAGGIALISAIGLGTGALMLPLWGRVTDRFGNRPVLLGCGAWAARIAERTSCRR